MTDQTQLCLPIGKDCLLCHCESSTCISVRASCLDLRIKTSCLWTRFQRGYVALFAVFLKYRIYSINRPGRILNFWTLRVGAYSRWALIRGWALIKISPFSASKVCLFCNKIMGCCRAPDPLNIAVNPRIFKSTLLTAMRMK